MSKKKYKPSKPAMLYVTDKADPSVGLFPCGWDVPAPFTKKEVKNCAVDKELIEFFRTEIIKVYQEYAQGQVVAEYDFENKEYYKSTT